MSAISQFFGRMFGSEKALETVVDGAVNGLDKLFYTEEEKQEDGRKERADARSMVIGWLQNSQGQNIARRFLAMLIAFTWLSQYATSQVLAIWAVWATKNVDKVQGSAKIVGDNADGMTGAMMLILGFYFAAPHLGKIVEGALTKFGGSTK